MNFKALSVLAAVCLLIAAAWFVRTPTAVQAEAVPEKYRETVQKGLDYLASKQHKDGHWEGDGGNHPVAMTGLVGLAFLMEREFRVGPWGRRVTVKRDDKYSANIRKAADWLMAQSEARRDGLIFSDHESETSRYMQGHGLATIFLAGVCESETDDARRKKLTEALARAVKYIALAQSTQGGWHDTSKVEGHDFANVPVTVIQLQALQAAENAGISATQESLGDAQEYLKAALAKGIGPAETAGILACLRSGIDESKPNFPRKWFEDCRSKIPAGTELKLGRDELAHYYFSQAEHQLGGAAWNAYRTAMFDRLRDAQNKDGSWPAGAGMCVGQVYSTAVWCTVLQLDNDSHPSKRRILMEVS